ncbi:hypothetical protein I8G32_04245 [Rhodopseudomonas palustris]|nr:hypothetical protein I8G32_04245 [Rhodopseudomonas palustris]
MGRSSETDAKRPRQTVCEGCDLIFLSESVFCVRTETVLTLLEGPIKSKLLQRSIEGAPHGPR